MITLFVVKSNAPHADRNRAVSSVCDMMVDVNIVDDVQTVDDINLFYKRTDWYMIIYDNECYEERLAAALTTFINDGRYDVLTLFKVEQRPLEVNMSQSQRVFKSHITLAPGSMQPDDGDYSVCAVQNGWIVSQ